MADKDVISYAKLGWMAGDLKDEMDRANEFFEELNRVRRLANKGDDASVWVGTAADAFSSAFYDAFRDLYEVMRTMSAYQGRLLRVSQSYAQADKAAKAIADNIEQAQWAEV